MPHLRKVGGAAFSRARREESGRKAGGKPGSNVWKTSREVREGRKEKEKSGRKVEGALHRPSFAYGSKERSREA